MYLSSPATSTFSLPQLPRAPAQRLVVTHVDDDATLVDASHAAPSTSEVPDSGESKHALAQQFVLRPSPAVHPIVSRAQSARQTLVTLIAGGDTDEAARSACAAISQLLEIASELTEGDVDRALSGFLCEAVASGHEKLVAAWVDAVAAIPGFHARKLALLQGAVPPVSLASWTPHLADRPTAPGSLAGSSLPARSRNFGVPILIRTFIRQRACSDSDQRWMSPVTEKESLAVRGSFAYVAALLDSPVLSDSQVGDVIGVRAMSLQSGGSGKRAERIQLTALQFAMRQYHVCGYGSLVLAIQTSTRPPEVRSALLQRLGVNPIWLAQKLGALERKPIPDDPEQDQFGWARVMAAELRELFGGPEPGEFERAASAIEMPVLPRPPSRRI